MSSYRQPGDPGYVAPDENFAGSQTIDQLIAGGYALTPEQIASLTPIQEMNHLYAVQGGSGFDPRFPGSNQQLGGDPNLIYEGPNMLVRLGRAALIAGVGAGFGQVLGAGLGSLGSGATGTGAASSSTIPSLTGISNVGTAAGTFPLTTMAPSALEAGLFPLTTAGATGLNAGLGAIGAGASALDLSNVATQGTIPQTDYFTWQNADRLRKGLGEINKFTSPQTTQSTEVSPETYQPYIPYDTDTPLNLNASTGLYLGDELNLNEDTGLRFAGGGAIDGGLSSLTAMNKGGYLDGPGDGMSDSIPATINGTQPAALADGEWVAAADLVSHIGNGSSKAGAKKLDEMAARIRQARTGNPKQGKQINPDEFLPA